MKNTKMPGPKAEFDPSVADVEYQKDQNEKAAEKVGGGAGRGRHVHRTSRRNKKVYKVVDLAAFASDPPSLEPNVVPQDFRYQINGASPIAIRNSEMVPYPVARWQNAHQTFGNVFDSLGKPKNPKSSESGQFAVRAEEFPSLRK